MHKIYVDGAYKNGECGIGVYLRNGLNAGDEFSAKIKVGSSVEGELKSIEFGLLRAYKFGFKDIEIYNDCQEAVDRFNEGRLEGYFSFSDLVTKFESVKVKKVDRDSNIGHAYSRDGLLTDFSIGCNQCLKWEIEFLNYCPDCGKNISLRR